MIVSNDDWEPMEDTLFWLSQPGIHEDIAEAEAELERGETASLEDIRRDLERRAG